MEGDGDGKHLADLTHPASTRGAGAIAVRRRHGLWADRLREYHVLIDDERVGTLGNGESATYPVEAGKHTVHLRIDWTRSESKSVDVSVGGTVTLECSARNPVGALYWITFGRNKYIRLDVAR